MRVVLSMYESRGDVERLAGFAVQLRSLGMELRVCEPQDCTELLGNVAVSLLSIGG